MKKIVVIICLLSVWLACNFCSSQTVDIIESSYPSGKPKVISKFKDDIKFLEKAYYPNGNLKYICQFRDTIMHGYKTEYYENGQISMEGKFDMGSIVDTVTYFTSTGNISSKKVYSDGILTTIIIMDPKSSLIQEIKYDSNGNYLWSQGRIGRQVTYENDFLNGTAIEYHLNGAIKAKGYWRPTEKGYEKAGEWTIYSEEGELVRTEEF